MFCNTNIPEMLALLVRYFRMVSKEALISATLLKRNEIYSYNYIAILHPLLRIK